MELIDRYLHAVKFWLPANQKQDIIAELSEDLRSQVEDRETELGRKLSESEVAELLKQRGRPFLIANRFLPQQSLIGPVLFPIYVFVLKMIAIFYMFPWVLVWIGLAIFHVTHPGPTVMEALASFWSSFWAMAFFLVGTLTAVFAVIERLQVRSGFLERWDPRKLPPVRNPNKIPRASSVIEVAANLVGCIWLIGGMWYQTVRHFSGVSITLAPVWRYFFWGFVSLAVANTALSAANLFRPYWTSWRASIRLAFDCIGSALFCWLLKSNILAAIAVANVDAAKTSLITAAINWWAEKIFPVAVIFGVIIAVTDVHRIVRARTKAMHPAALKAVSGTH